MRRMVRCREDSMTVKETTNPTKKLGSEEFGAWLAAKRKDVGMSRYELADACGISYPYVSQLETGYRNPSAAVVQALSVALGVDAGELLAMAFPSDMVNQTGTMEMLRHAFTRNARLISPGDKVTVIDTVIDGNVIALELNDGTTITLKADRR
jgi:transcriptional regulator with XRE-family HTH domain